MVQHRRSSSSHRTCLNQSSNVWCMMMKRCSSCAFCCSAALHRSRGGEDIASKRTTTTTRRRRRRRNRGESSGRRTSSPKAGWCRPADIASSALCVVTAVVVDARQRQHQHSSAVAEVAAVAAANAADSDCCWCAHEPLRCEQFVYLVRDSTARLCSFGREMYCLLFLSFRFAFVSCTRLLPKGRTETLSAYPCDERSSRRRLAPTMSLFRLGVNPLGEDDMRFMVRAPVLR